MFADTKEWVTRIEKRFKNIRTDYHKLIREKVAKSGSAQHKSMTALQRWKLDKYAFLAQYHTQKPGTQCKASSLVGSTVSEHSASELSTDEAAERHVPTSSAASSAKRTPEDCSSLTSPPPVVRRGKRTRDKEDEDFKQQMVSHH